uniref:Helitron helicase-like domain-containing protein n=1 Tax=Amphimedon queenslandica TaxID=400682 RepID=A0A1X7SJ27_AMPQE
MHGAPHYHILLWIENAPVVGIDCPEEVCSFIEDRITCHIPASNTSPDLNFFGNKILNAQVQQILQSKH